MPTLASYFDLAHQLGFYGAYHSKPGNILIHVVLVPLLFLTFLAFLALLLPPPAGLARFTTTVGHLINVPLVVEFGGGTLLAIVYEAYYLALDVPLGLMYLPILLPMLLLANGLAQDPKRWLGPMIVVNVGSWIAQILSHRFIEGGAPALLDNLVGALVLAPFFTFIEAVLHLTSYRPALKREIQNASGRYIAEMRKGIKARL